MTKYRKLRKGERLRQGDELDMGMYWVKTTMSGCVIGATYHTKGCTYRRKTVKKGSR